MQRECEPASGFAHTKAFRQRETSSARQPRVSVRNDGNARNREYRGNPAVNVNYYYYYQLANRGPREIKSFIAYYLNDKRIFRKNMRAPVYISPANSFIARNKFSIPADALCGRKKFLA